MKLHKLFCLLCLASVPALNGCFGSDEEESSSTPPIVVVPPDVSPDEGGNGGSTVGEGTIAIKDCAIAFYTGDDFSDDNCLGKVRLGKTNEVPVSGCGTNQYIYVCYELYEYENNLGIDDAQIEFTIKITGLDGFSIEGDSSYRVESSNNGKTVEIHFNSTPLSEGKVNTFLRLPFYMKRTGGEESSRNRVDIQVTAGLLGSDSADISVMNTQSTFSIEGGAPLSIGNVSVDPKTGLVSWTVDENATECRVSESTNPTQVSRNLLSGLHGNEIEYQLPRDSFVENGTLTIRTHSKFIGYEDSDKTVEYHVLAAPTFSIDAAYDYEADAQAFTLNPQVEGDDYTNYFDLLAADSIIGSYAKKSSIDITSAVMAFGTGRTELTIQSSYQGSTKNVINSESAACYYVSKLQAPTLSLGGRSLSWDSITGATGYNVYEDGVLIDTVTDTTFTLSESYMKRYEVKAIFDSASAPDVGREIRINSDLSNSVVSKLA